MYSEYEINEMGITREDACILESAEIEMLESCAALNVCEQMEKFNMMKAELKCMQEDGDVLQLAEFYEDAAAKTEPKKEGFFKEAWKKIKSLLDHIKKFLFGEKTIKDPNRELEVDSEELEKTNKLIEAWNKHIKPSGFKIAGIAAIIAVVTGMGVFAKKKGAFKTIKIKAGELFKKEKAVEEMTETLSGKAESVGAEAEKASQGNVVTQFMNKLVTAFKGALSWMKAKLFGGGGENNSEGASSSGTNAGASNAGDSATDDSDDVNVSKKTKRRARKSASKGTNSLASLLYKQVIGNATNVKNFDKKAASFLNNLDLAAANITDKDGNPIDEAGRTKLVSSVISEVRKEAAKNNVKLEWGDVKDKYDYEIFLEDCAAMMGSEVSDDPDLFEESMDEFDESGELIEDDDLASLLAMI